MIKESQDKDEDGTERQVKRNKVRNTEIMKTSYKSVEATRRYFH